VPVAVSEMGGAPAADRFPHKLLSCDDEREEEEQRSGDLAR